MRTVKSRKATRKVSRRKMRGARSTSRKRERSQMQGKRQTWSQISLSCHSVDVWPEDLPAWTWLIWSSEHLVMKSVPTFMRGAFRGALKIRGSNSWSRRWKRQCWELRPTVAKDDGAETMVPRTGQPEHSTSPSWENCLLHGMLWRRHQWHQETNQPEPCCWMRIGGPAGQ